jgi:hypothetical protein
MPTVGFYFGEYLKAENNYPWFQLANKNIFDSGESQLCVTLFQPCTMHNKYVHAVLPPLQILLCIPLQMKKERGKMREFSLEENWFLHPGRGRQLSVNTAKVDSRLRVDPWLCGRL